MPNYGFGAAAPVFCNHYYSTLDQDGIEIISERIVRIHGKTIVTDDGKSRVVDVVILGTGYDQVYRQSGRSFNIPVYLGKKDISARIWSRSDNYLSIMRDGVPNLFFLGGPNSVRFFSKKAINISTSFSVPILLRRVWCHNFLRRNAQ